MKYPKVRALASNQYEIMTKAGIYFQSYSTIIAFAPRDPSKKIKLDKTYWDYSRTTGKYRSKFLGESSTETRQGIKDGKYTLTNLN